LGINQLSLTRRSGFFGWVKSIAKEQWFLLFGDVFHLFHKWENGTMGFLWLSRHCLGGGYFLVSGFQKQKCAGKVESLPTRL